MEDKGNAKQKKKNNSGKNQISRYSAIRQTWKGWANFFNKIIRIRGCAALDVAYLKQDLEGREKDSLDQLRQAFKVKGTTQSYFLSFNYKFFGW